MPFGSIALPGITKWAGRPKSNQVLQTSNIDLDAVSDGFGIPSVDDPDPFGVLALEQAGLEIKEAGTQSRPTSDTFEFKPSPTSPVFRHSFQSIDRVSRRTSRRDSKRSNLSVDHGTQTANLPPIISENPDTPTSLSYAASERDDSVLESPGGASSKRSTANTAPEQDAVRVSRIGQLDTDQDAAKESAFPTQNNDTQYGNLDSRLRRDLGCQQSPEVSPLSRSEAFQPGSSKGHSLSTLHDPSLEDDDESGAWSDQSSDHEAIIEEAETAVHVAAQAIASPKATRAKIVVIPRRAPPALPPRNPRRHRVRQDFAEDQTPRSAQFPDDSSGTYSPSPTASAFDRSDENSTRTWSEQTSLPDVESVLQVKEGLSLEDVIRDKERKVESLDTPLSQLVKDTIHRDDDHTEDDDKTYLEVRPEEARESTVEPFGIDTFVESVKVEPQKFDETPMPPTSNAMTSSENNNEQCPKQESPRQEKVLVDASTTPMDSGRTLVEENSADDAREQRRNSGTAAVGLGLGLDAAVMEQVASLILDTEPGHQGLGGEQIKRSVVSQSTSEASGEEHENGGMEEAFHSMPESPL